jgi:glycosyltransferase involved in cell wall biosynthesis
MRVIFLNRFFHPDHSATSQMLSDLAFALAQSGTQALAPSTTPAAAPSGAQACAPSTTPAAAQPRTQAAAQPGAPAGREGPVTVSVIASRQLYDDPARRLPARETVAGVHIIRIPTSRFGRANLAGRALDYLSFYAAAAWALWRTARRGDIVVAMTDPPALSLLAVPIAHAKGARAVNWLQDIFPEVAERLGVGRRSRAARAAVALLRRLRDRSLVAADANVVLGRRMAGHLAALGVPGERLAAIPNWADGAAIAPVAPAANPLRRQWGLGLPRHTFVVGYSGNLGRAHDIGTLLEAIALASRAPAAAGTAASLPRIAWLFIGGGIGFDSLRRSLADIGGAEGTPCVRFEPYQPRARLAESLSAADVHLVSLRPELEGLIVPSKFYGIAAAGRPAVFIGDPDGELARVIAAAGCGLTVRQGDGAALARAALRLAADPALCASMGAAARRLFEAEYDQPIAVARWQALLRGHTAPARS